MDLRLLRNDRPYKVKEVGIFTPIEKPCDSLYVWVLISLSRMPCRHTGQVGYASMGIKSPAEVVTGDVFFDGTEAPNCDNYIEPVKHMVLLSKATYY